MKKIIIGIVLAIILAVVVGYYLYNKPHIDVSKQKADYSLTADDLYKEFDEDLMNAINKYADRVVEVTGRLQTISQSDKRISNIVMTGDMATVNCEMDSLFVHRLALSKEGDQVKIRGIFVGFDDLLEELQLRKCIVVE